MTNNNQQFLIQHEEFNKNFIFPSINNINTQQVITLYENFKKILPNAQKYSKDLKVRRNLSDILDELVSISTLDKIGIVFLLSTTE